jgi:hypothetical protein
MGIHVVRIPAAEGAYSAPERLSDSVGCIRVASQAADRRSAEGPLRRSHLLVDCLE